MVALGSSLMSAADLKGLRRTDGGAAAAAHTELQRLPTERTRKISGLFINPDFSVASKDLAQALFFSHIFSIVCDTLVSSANFADFVSRSRDGLTTHL